MRDVTDASVQVVRPRGRPRAPEPGSSVSTWVPQAYHDRLIQLAEKHDVSVSSLVKTLLVLQLRKP
jgi:hypothetical protein